MWAGHRRSGEATVKAPFRSQSVGNPLVVQWLGLYAFAAQSPVSVPGQRTRIPHAVRCGQSAES